MIDQMNIEKKDGIEVVNINPKVYSLDVVYSAAYTFLDRAYIVLDGDPEDKILVKIKPKDENDDKVGLDFNNELLNYAEYDNNLKRNKDIRTAILNRALLTNDPQAAEDQEFDELLESLEDDDENSEDSDDIVVPWEDEDQEKSDENTDDSSQETSDSSENSDEKNG